MQTTYSKYLLGAHSLQLLQVGSKAGLGIGIDKTNAGISIPASRILVRYRTSKMSDCVRLVRYRTCSGIVSFFQSDTGLTGCRTVRHSGISIYSIYTWTLTWACSIDMDMTCSMDMDMQYGHGHAAWTCTRNMALVMQRVSGQWTCKDAD